MVSTRKKKQQKKRLFNQPLSERYTDFMIGQSNQHEQTESRDNMLRRGTPSGNASNSAQTNYPQVDVHTLEENIVSKMRSEVENVMTSVECGVQDAVSTAIENSVPPRVELAMKSANVHSERSVDCNVLEHDQRYFLGKIEGLRMTASSRINSHTDLSRIDETRCNITVDKGDLLVNEKTLTGQQTLFTATPKTAMISLISLQYLKMTSIEFLRLGKKLLRNYKTRQLKINILGASISLREKNIINKFSANSVSDT